MCMARHVYMHKVKWQWTRKRSILNDLQNQKHGEERTLGIQILFRPRWSFQSLRCTIIQRAVGMSRCLSVCVVYDSERTECGGFNFFKTKFSAVLQQTVHHKEQTSWQMQVPTLNKELFYTMWARWWLSSIFQDTLESDNRYMILINTCDNSNHPGKRRCMVIVLIIMYHKVRENHGGWPRPVEIARGSVLISMSWPTKEAERVPTDSGLRPSKAVVVQ